MCLIPPLPVSLPILFSLLSGPEASVFLDFLKNHLFPFRTFICCSHSQKESCYFVIPPLSLRLQFKCHFLGKASLIPRPGSGPSLVRAHRSLYSSIIYRYSNCMIIHVISNVMLIPTLECKLHWTAIFSACSQLCFQHLAHFPACSRGILTEISIH